MRRLGCLSILAFGILRGQTLTISQAVETALRNYPSVKVSQEEIAAAAAGIQLARTAYLPRIDGIAQVNRATRNNVFGMLLPQSGRTDRHHAARHPAPRCFQRHAAA